MEKENGCVYFVKHKGLTPVKIGYSSGPNPKHRIEQIKTYAPFGIDFLGFINSKSAKKLETELHLKYKNFRLNGEWFNISEETVENILNDNYSEIQKNEIMTFQEFYLKQLPSKPKTIDTVFFDENFLKVISNIKYNEVIYTNNIIDYVNYSYKEFFVKLRKHCLDNNIKIIKNRDAKGRNFELIKN